MNVLRRQIAEIGYVQLLKDDSLELLVSLLGGDAFVHGLLDLGLKQVAFLGH